MNKEQVYDEKISPLMKQIIAICQEHNIGMLTSFAIEHDGEGPNGEDCSSLTCNTVLPDESGKLKPFHAVAINAIHNRGRLPGINLTTVNEDGSKTLTAFI